MLFCQRRRVGIWERIRLWLWPRRSFSRSCRYIGKRILRIQAKPHCIALGLAIGVLAAFTPFYGLHILIAILIAWLVSANIAAAILGTLFANPLTIPVIFSLTYTLGGIILPNKVEPISPYQFYMLLWSGDFSQLWVSIAKLIVGSVVLGSIVALLVYKITVKAIMHFQENRDNRQFRTNHTAKKQP